MPFSTIHLNAWINLGENQALVCHLQNEGRPHSLWKLFPFHFARREKYTACFQETRAQKGTCEEDERKERATKGRKIKADHSSSTDDSSPECDMTKHLYKGEMKNLLKFLWPVAVQSLTQEIFLQSYRRS